MQDFSRFLIEKINRLALSESILRIFEANIRQKKKNSRLLTKTFLKIILRKSTILLICLILFFATTNTLPATSQLRTPL